MNKKEIDIEDLLGKLFYLKRIYEYEEQLQKMKENLNLDELYAIRDNKNLKELLTEKTL